MIYLVKENHYSGYFPSPTLSQWRKHHLIEGIRLTVFSLRPATLSHALSHNISFRLFCVSGWVSGKRKDTQKHCQNVSPLCGSFCLECPLILPSKVQTIQKPGKTFCSHIPLPPSPDPPQTLSVCARGQRQAGGCRQGQRPSFPTSTSTAWEGRGAGGLATPLPGFSRSCWFCFYILCFWWRLFFFFFLQKALHCFRGKKVEREMEG